MNNAALVAGQFIAFGRIGLVHFGEFNKVLGRLRNGAAEKADDDAPGRLAANGKVEKDLNCAKKTAKIDAGRQMLRVAHLVCYFRSLVLSGDDGKSGEKE